VCSRIYYRTLSYFVCNFTSLEAKNCWSGFETGRPRDSCYDFVMYIYNQSLSKRTFLRLVVVITPLHPSIRSYEVIVSIVAFQILFFMVLRCFLRVKSRELARYFRVGFETFDGSDSPSLSFPVPP